MFLLNFHKKTFKRLYQEELEPGSSPQFQQETVYSLEENEPKSPQLKDIRHRRKHRSENRRSNKNSYTKPWDSSWDLPDSAPWIVACTMQAKNQRILLRSNWHALGRRSTDTIFGISPRTPWGSPTTALDGGEALPTDHSTQFTSRWLTNKQGNVLNILPSR